MSRLGIPSLHSTTFARMCENSVEQVSQVAVATDRPLMLSAVRPGRHLQDYEKRKDTKPVSDTGLRPSLSLCSKND